MQTKNEFRVIADEIISLVRQWENIFITLATERTLNPKNVQNRSIKQILGHLIDSASNNHQRMVRLQMESNLVFPDYRLQNDSWIAIQHYEEEHWINLVQFWKFFNFHIAHFIVYIDAGKLQNSWTDCGGETVTLEKMVHGYLSHLKLHLGEIEDLLQ